MPYSSESVMFLRRSPSKARLSQCRQPPDRSRRFSRLLCFFHDFQGVYKPCKDDYRRAVLIVVKNGNIKFIVKAFFDFKATGTWNVFKVYAAETYRKVFHDIYDFVGILRVKTNRKRVDAPNSLNSTHFPSITGIAERPPRFPSPRIALPSDTTATRFPRRV